MIKETSGSSVPSILQQVEVNESPPTYNRTNSFSSSFQGMIDAFGVATYQEVNPGFWTELCLNKFIFYVWLWNWVKFNKVNKNATSTIYSHHMTLYYFETNFFIDFFVTTFYKQSKSHFLFINSILFIFFS